MQRLYCDNCQQQTGFKRAQSFGTLFMVLLTFGLWLFIIPFYPIRCNICGCTKSGLEGVTQVMWIVLFLGFFLFLAMLFGHS